jgi:hypothetical protein
MPSTPRDDGHPDTPLWKHRWRISNTDDDLIAGGRPFIEVSDVAEAAQLI